MGKPLTGTQMRLAGVRLGSHDLCYRCDSFEKNSDGTCELCGLTDRIDRCVFEWCPYCKKPNLENYYIERCTAGGATRHSAPIVGPLTTQYIPSVSVFTYAILCGSHVKIGRSKDPARRFAQLRTGAPVPPRIVGIVAGDVERSVHRRLHDAGVKRTNGEWFEYSDVVGAVLAEYRFAPAGSGV